MKVRFMPSGIEVECKPNESIFEAALRVGVEIENTCGGGGSCGICRIKIEGGEEYLNKSNATEKSHIGNTYFITHCRLSCQTKFISDGEVIVSLGKNKNGQDSNH